jgi:hypothetical protein
VGSVAFQITVALWPDRLQKVAWLIPWTWGLWAAIWIVWLITHPTFISSIFGRSIKLEADGPPKYIPPPQVQASVSDSGNSAATATGNSLSVNFPAPAPPFIPPAPQQYFPVNVSLEPSHGQFDKMYLRVMNRSEEQMFQAQCKVLGRHNDPNPQHLVTFPLAWEVPHGRAIRLLTGESGNLLIASAGEDQSTAWIKLESASSVVGPDSRWGRESRNERLPRYDLEITILGQQSKHPQSERFTLSAGTNCALGFINPS